VEKAVFGSFGAVVKVTGRFLFLEEGKLGGLGAQKRKKKGFGGRGSLPGALLGASMGIRTDFASEIVKRTSFFP